MNISLIIKSVKITVCIAIVFIIAFISYVKYRDLTDEWFVLFKPEDGMQFIECKPRLLTLRKISKENNLDLKKSVLHWAKGKLENNRSVKINSCYIFQIWGNLESGVNASIKCEMEKP